MARPRLPCLPQSQRLGTLPTAAVRSVRTCALRRGNQLQQFLRIIQPLFELRPQRLRRQLRGHRYFPRRRVGCHELDLINPDGRILVVAQSLLDLLGEVLRLGTAHGEGAHQPRKVIERNFIGEQNTGKSRSIQQLREAALGLPRLERNAVEKEFVVRDPEQKPSIAALGQCLLQFVPSRLELIFGTLVIHSIKPRVLDQNIEAMQERPGRCATAGIG